MDIKQLFLSEHTGQGKPTNTTMPTPASANTKPSCLHRLIDSSPLCTSRDANEPLITIKLDFGNEGQVQRDAILYIGTTWQRHVPGRADSEGGLAADRERSDELYELRHLLACFGPEVEKLVETRFPLTSVCESVSDGHFLPAHQALCSNSVGMLSL